MEALGVVNKLKLQAPTPYEQQHLLGFRGFLAIETFVWVFLQTFVPVAVAGSRDTNGKLWQQVLRKSLSVLFWNEYFLYGSIIFLSARSIAIPFIRNPSKERVARAVLCRGITLWFPVAVSLAIIKLAFSKDMLAQIYQFKIKTGNQSMQVPYYIPNALAYFNSVFNMFWTTHNFSVQAASTAFPSQTLWLVCAVYIQSYTVYMTMIIIPFTRNRWRVQGSILFILAAWWCFSWAFYSISGLILADMVINMKFKERAQRGIPIDLLNKKDGMPRRLPTWIPAVGLIVAGLVMQFLWTDWRPAYMDREYMYHSGLYYTGGLNVQYESRHIPARDDIYLIVVGFFILLESSHVLQKLFSNRFFLYLGRRSLSFFLIQSTMIYLAGTKVFTSLHHDRGVNFPGSVFVTFLTCLAIVVPAAEVFYRAVEIPSKVFAHKFYDFITA